jgi:hypothetical protein
MDQENMKAGIPFGTSGLFFRDAGGRMPRERGTGLAR